MKSEAWKQQRVLKSQDIPEHQQMVNNIYEFDFLQEQALYALTYLTAGRITELVECPYLRRVTYKRETIKKNGRRVNIIARNDRGSPIQEKVTKVYIHYTGLRKKDLTYTNIRGKDILLINMANRKNKEFTRKNIPIPINHESPFMEIINSYIDTLQRDTDQLFPFKMRKAQRIISKIGFNPHFLRDVRLTHMVTLYQYNTHQLVKFAGWKSIAPAERYVRLGVGDLVENF